MIQYTDHFSDREIDFIFRFFLPDYQNSSVKNEIGEWLLGNRDECPASRDEIDAWFKSWIALMDKAPDIGEHFYSNKRLPWFTKSPSYFHDAWEYAVLHWRAEGGSIIERYLDLLNRVHSAVRRTYRARRKKRRAHLKVKRRPRKLTRMHPRPTIGTAVPAEASDFRII